MAVKNIKMQNLFLNANIAIELKDATEIEIRNSVILAKNNKPGVYIESCKNISLDGVKFNPDVDVLFDINGVAVSNIQMKNSDLKKESVKAVFNHGANEKSFDLILSPHH